MRYIWHDYRIARYRTRTAQGHRFVFAFDEDATDLLHIYVRHLTTETDAIMTFFFGTTEWNSERDRFETFTATHGLYWFWINQDDKVVMVISCFRTGE